MGLRRVAAGICIPYSWRDKPGIDSVAQEYIEEQVSSWHELVDKVFPNFDFATLTLETGEQSTSG